MKLFFSLTVFSVVGFMGPLNAQDIAMKSTLDGEWQFRTDSAKVGVDSAWFADSLDRSLWDKMQVPQFWENHAGLAAYDGWGWFSRTAKIVKTDQPLSIHFSGVDDDARVWVNGIEVGNHSGYPEPFAVPLDSALRLGDNHIAVLVMDNGGAGGISKSVTLIETNHLDDLLKSPYYGKPALKSANWVRDAVMYEVYLRSFSKEGNFAGLEKRLPELKSLGVTVLCLMPIHPVGVKNRRGSLGSPYAVQDLYGINPEFGTLRDFKRLVNAVHKAGLKLIIDLVASSTSTDSKLLQKHPEWSTVAETSDVVMLDYSKRELRRFMMDVMVYWVRDVGIDGFRCDAAEMVPLDFWETARTRLNRIKTVMMVSDGSSPEHHMKAFDLTSSWNIHSVFDLLLSQQKPVSFLDNLLKAEALQYPVGSLRLRFNTHHTGDSTGLPAVQRYGEQGLKLAAVLAHTVPGVPLIFNGDEAASVKPLSFVERVDIDWSRPSEMPALYQNLSLVRKAHKALSRGEMIRVESNFSQDVYAFFRTAGNDRVLAVMNFGQEARFATISIPMKRLFAGQGLGEMREIFTSERIEVGEAARESLTLALEPLEYRVYVLEK